jgi:hypothetical protein
MYGTYTFYLFFGIYWNWHILSRHHGTLLAYIPTWGIASIRQTTDMRDVVYELRDADGKPECIVGSDNCLTSQSDNLTHCQDDKIMVNVLSWRQVRMCVLSLWHDFVCIRFYPKNSSPNLNCWIDTESQRTPTNWDSVIFQTTTKKQHSSQRFQFPVHLQDICTKEDA